MGRARRQLQGCPLLGCTVESCDLAAAEASDDEAHGRVGTQDMRSLCSAVLQYLASPVLGQMPRVCSATELRDHISACRACTEVDDGALHTALLALERVGAFTRIGYGPDALYAVKPPLPLPAGMQASPQAKQTSTSQEPCWHLLKAGICSAGSVTGGGDRQPAEAAKGLGAAAGSATQHRQQTVKLTKRAVEVKIPLLCIERGIHKHRAARTRRQKAQSHADKPSSSAS